MKTAKFLRNLAAWVRDSDANVAAVVRSSLYEAGIDDTEDGDDADEVARTLDILADQVEQGDVP